MHLLEQNWPRVDSHLAQRAIQSHEALERFLRERSPLFNFLKDAFVNQIEELRHHGKGGDIPLLQGAQKLGRVQRLQVHHARAFHQRQKQIRHLRQHVKHGQYAEQRVGWAQVDPIEHRFDLALEVGVGKHHALGIGSCSRGVKKGSEIFRSGRHRLEFPRPSIENCW